MRILITVLFLVYFVSVSMAADIVVGGHDAYRLMRLAIVHEFKGIGVSQRGMFERRFIHLDTMEDGDHHPRPWVWSYK